MAGKADIQKIAAENAEKHGLELDLVLAIITVESNFDPLAHRFEPHWNYALESAAQAHFAQQNKLSLATENVDESTSFGNMQIMGSVCRELGFSGNLAQLFDPEYGIHYGCLKLKLELKKHPDLTDAISAYNQGSPRRVGGIYANQDYVDKVMANYRGLKTQGETNAGSN
jgi:soluble lytic murein transglycosylase-like protein